MRILYFGMLGPFSLPPLQALLAADHTVVGVIVPAQTASTLAVEQLPPPAPVSQLPMARPFAAESIVQLAWQHHIPVWRLADVTAVASHNLVKKLSPHLAVVACFPRRIPTALLTLPRHGFFNIHPALLPAFRGPEPLFWTFRQGVTQTGVTLHQMSDRFDEGDIVAQVTYELPDGISGPAAEAALARLGGSLLTTAVSHLAAGTVTAIPQPDGGSYFPTPGPDAFRLPVSWSARRAFNFMRGTAHWQRPYLIETADELLVARTAVSYSAHGKLPRPTVRENEKLRLQFTPGILTISDR